MSNRFSHIFFFSPKIEWLSGKSSVTFNAWNIDQVLARTSPYQPLPTAYTPQYMISEDRSEEERLLQQDALGSFINNWLLAMVSQDFPLREKIALFWHHHIPSGAGHRVEHAILLVEVFRKHALGHLRDLLVEAAANPAIMYFLDGHHSHKDNPNENFARELMELFTLGEGHYTLNDVKEAARAFTGRRFDHDNYPYSMYIDPAAFDDREKTILGKTGRFNGEDVIDILLEQPQTAKTVATAFLRFFFADEPPEGMILDCAEAYYNSQYAMPALLQAMYIHPEFTKEEYHLSKTKTPVELLTGFQRQTGLRTVGMKTALRFLSACGQHLFHPPNVAGWPKGKAWLKGEYLVNRLFLPSAFMEISNREMPKNSLAYKVNSRLVAPSKRELRYISDARWDEKAFLPALQSQSISVSKWLVGRELPSNIPADVLQSPEYQYY